MSGHVPVPDGRFGARQDQFIALIGFAEASLDRAAFGNLMLQVRARPVPRVDFLVEVPPKEAGAGEADALAMRDDPAANAALTDALIGVYERNALGRPSTAVLPYAQALSRFPAHLQQLDMESNGKALRRDGTMSELATGPAVFGEPGTNGQHSFYQLLHQGTDVIPLQFIAFRKNQSAFDPEFEGSTARRKLNANLAAQIVAFAQGKRDENPNKSFPGGRPSTLLVADELDPRSLGALLAHYENKVMFQGFAWNLNSFDQEGVQLGKVLTKQVLAARGPSDPALAEFARILGAL